MGHAYSFVVPTIQLLSYCMIKNLKDQMKKDPAAPGRATMVVLCQEVLHFNPQLKNAYQYEVLGGFHSYIAQQELNAEFPDNLFFKEVMADIYLGLNDEVTHNFTLKVTCVFPLVFSMMTENPKMHRCKTNTQVFSQCNAYKVMMGDLVYIMGGLIMTLSQTKSLLI